MANKKDLAEAQSYSRRRLVTAFSSGIPDGVELTPKKNQTPVIVGVGLTVIAILVSLFYGMVSPSLPDGWENNKLIVAKNSAARYVSSNGTLHPVINAISARLLIPSSDFKVLTVADDQLKNIPIGSTIGILGAPDSLPEENNLIAGSINSCVSDSNVTTTLSNASSQVTDTATAIVANVDGISYLVNGSHRYQLPQEATLRDAFLRAFGIPETASTDATAQWINLFEQGSPIEQISVDGAGNSITVHGVEALVGSVVMQQGDAKKTKYVVRSDGSLSPLTDFTYGLYITGKTDEFTQPNVLSAADFQFFSNSTESAIPEDWPSEELSATSGNVSACAIYNLETAGRKKADTHVNLAVKQNNSAHSGTSKTNPSSNTSSTVKLKGGRQQLVITEIPYTMIGANIGKFLNDIASLVENKKATDIVDISNQSSKEGIRIVLDLKRDADVENLTNMLYKKTKLEDTFGVNMLAVADGRPETLSLKQVIEHHVDFVFDVTTRKYTTLLNKEQEKKEIQEGLIKACDVIDLIIEILRGSKNREQVKKCLVDGVTEGIRFKSKSSEKAAQKLHFSEKQAAAILDMRLYKLIGLEIEALQADYAETMKNIAIYEDILNNYDSMAEVIMKELDQIKKEYGTKRRTVIENAEEVVYEEKKMEEMEVTFLMDRFGYMRTIDKSAYERNKEAANAENKYVFNCMNTDKICIFTDNGKMHSIKVADIPLVRFRDKGTPADNLSNYDSAQERMLYVAPLASVKENTLLFVTAASMCKLVSGAEFDVAKRTIVSTKLAEEDSLIFVGSADEMEQVVFQSEGGYFLRFQKQDISAMKKTSIGVRGMKLAEGDKLDHAYLLESRQEYTITYHDKPYVLNRIKLSKRDSKGTKPRI